MNDRINWIDITRGIAMIAVVMGHMLFSGDLYNYLFSFQVSLFFLISGISYGVSNKYVDMDLKTFIKIKWKKLVIPYFWLNIICFPIWFINNIVLSGKGLTSIMKVIIGIFYSNQTVLPMSSYSTWFLTCLFLVSIIFKYIQKKTNNNKIKIFIIIFLMGVSGMILPMFGVKLSLPWHLQTILTATPFYYIGYIYIKNMNKIEIFIGKFIKNKYVKYIFIIIFLVIGFMIAKENGKISLRNSNFKNGFYFYSAALITSFAYISLSKNIGKSKILEFIGTNTLVILAFHRIIFRFFLYLSSPTKLFVESYPIITGILIMIMIYPIIIFINKYMPFVIGKNKKVIVRN